MRFFIFQINLKKHLEKHRDEAMAVMDGLGQREGFLPISKQLKLVRRPKSGRNDEFICAFTRFLALSAINVDHRPHLEPGRNLQPCFLAASLSRLLAAGLIQS